MKPKWCIPFGSTGAHNICVYVWPKYQAHAFNYWLLFGISNVSNSDYILTLSRRRPIYRNQSNDLLCKSVDWFLCDIGLRRERVKLLWRLSLWEDVIKSFFKDKLPMTTNCWIYSVVRLVETLANWKRMVVTLMNLLKRLCFMHCLDITTSQNSKRNTLSTEWHP